MHTEHTTKLNNEPALRTLPLNVESSPSTKLNTELASPPKLNDEAALRATLVQIGLTLDGVTDLAEFLHLRATKLYRRHPQFQAFLDAQTAYCPPGTSAADRWRHYRDGCAAHKVCVECGTPVKDYRNTYCSELCANRATIVSRGRSKNALKLLADPDRPVAPGAEKARWFEHSLAKHRPDYAVVAYGEPASTFRHSCGRTFEATNRNMLYGQGNCRCLHRKGVGRSLATAQRLFDEHGSDWLPQSATTTGVKCIHRVCGHVQDLAVDDYAQPCAVCAETTVPSWDALTVDPHREWLAEYKPDYQLLGTWESPTTPLRYRHLVCDQVFDAAPVYMQRPESECPICSAAKQAPMPLSVVAMKALVASHLAEHPDWSSTTLLYGDAAPRIPYFDNQPEGGRQRHFFFPHFFLPDRNLLIQVCVPADLGLALTADAHGGLRLWDAHCAKVEACKREGFKFLALLFVGERGTVMVDGWGGFNYIKAMNYFQARFGHATLA